MCIIELLVNKQEEITELKMAGHEQVYPVGNHHAVQMKYMLVIQAATLTE